MSSKLSCLINFTINLQSFARNLKLTDTLIALDAPERNVTYARIPPNALDFHSEYTHIHTQNILPPLIRKLTQIRHEDEGTLLEGGRRRSGRRRKVGIHRSRG